MFDFFREVATWFRELLALRLIGAALFVAPDRMAICIARGVVRELKPHLLELQSEVKDVADKSSHRGVRPVHQDP